MTQKVKTPKSVYIMIAAGFGLGAVTMAGIQSGATVQRAFADARLTPVSSTRTENLSALRGLNESFADLAEFVAPAVVSIQATSGREAGPNGERMPVRGGEGSGFVFRSDGYIMTNDHVVGGFDKVTVIFRDGRSYEGTVTRATESDIAIVKIEARDLPTLAFADSSGLRPGQLCMAVGAPFGLQNSVTFGNISALGRHTDIRGNSMFDQARYYPDLIQTDASINMGNSGGPLINIDGQVIGVNTAIYSPTGTSAGIGFAIPSNQARFISDILLDKGKITRSMMGVLPEDLKEFEKKDLNLPGGARLTTVQSNTPAAKAGLRDGDIVTRIGDRPIRSQLDLRNAMLLFAPGTSVEVEAVRAGRSMKVQVQLEEAQAPAQPTPQPRGRQPEQPDRNFPRGFDGRERELFEEFRRRFENVEPEEGPIRSGQARLGVSVGNITDEIRAERGIPTYILGAYVGEVEPGSVAQRVGIRPGDVITMVGDKPVVDAESLTQAMQGVNWGETRKIRFGRYSRGSSSTQELLVAFR
jgi:serine protease Do